MKLIPTDDSTIPDPTNFFLPNTASWPSLCYHTGQSYWLRVFAHHSASTRGHAYFKQGGVLLTHRYFSTGTAVFALREYWGLRLILVQTVPCCTAEHFYDFAKAEFLGSMACLCPRIPGNCFFSLCQVYIRCSILGYALTAHECSAWVAFAEVSLLAPAMITVLYGACILYVEVPLKSLLQMFFNCANELVILLKGTDLCPSSALYAN